MQIIDKHPSKFPAPDLNFCSTMDNQNR